MSNDVDAAQTQQYQYDALGRLVRAEHAGGNVASYGYDAVGNRVSLGNTVPISAGTYTYEAYRGQVHFLTVSRTVSGSGSLPGRKQKAPDVPPTFE